MLLGSALSKIYIIPEVYYVARENGGDLLAEYFIVRVWLVI